VDYFVKEIYPRIKDFNTLVIVNVSGSTIEEYVQVAERINELSNIPAIELNISCPNVKLGGMAFGNVPSSAREVTIAVKKVYKKDLIVKLSPNVTSIVEIAKAVVDGGADMVSLINTILGMAIDADRQRPILSTVTGGLSGPAIKPIALRMVWQVHKAVKVPIIGMGGIMNATDAIEFMLAGASAIQVGTANFIDPAVSVKIVNGIEAYLRLHKINSAAELVGALKTD
jgi:dihydroorotate dehydrogenase (NAD+) catalytic subunit